MKVMQQHEARRVIEPRQQSFDEQRQRGMRDFQLDRRRQHRQQAAARRGQPDEAIFATTVRDVMLAGFSGAVDDLALEQLQIAADQMANAFGIAVSMSSGLMEFSKSGGLV